MKNQKPYDKFIMSNDVVACAYDELLLDESNFCGDGILKDGVYEAAIEKQVRHQFNKMAKEVDELRKDLEVFAQIRVDPCPHCQCSELLCGWPGDCSSENSDA